MSVMRVRSRRAASAAITGLTFQGLVRAMTLKGQAMGLYFYALGHGRRDRRWCDERECFLGCVRGDDELVAVPTHCDNVARMTDVLFDLAAYTADIDADGVGVPRVRVHPEK